MAEDLKHNLAADIERYLAALSKFYAQNGKRDIQQIIVNAQVRVVEGWTYDNWNGGTHGHALYLTIPDALFMPITKERDEFQNEIARDLNKLHNFQHEFIAEVFIEMDFSLDGDWRKESGLLVTATRTVAPEATKRVWQDDSYRIFLSHKSEVKRETAKLKSRLGCFGASAFVAHDDIHPTKEWQDEIENALATMDAFVALMTDKFHDSDWTDQEVGYALARGVPIIAVSLGRKPYGFLGKFQALSSDWDKAGNNIIKLLINQERMISAYIRVLRECPNFDTGNILSTVLSSIHHLSTQQIDDIVKAYNENGELQGSFGFNGTKPFTWGDGIIPHLHRLGSQRFEMGSSSAVIRLVKKVSAKSEQDDEIPF